MVKGLVAGGVNLALALLQGAALPGPGAVLAAGVVGFLGYGVSLALFILGLRHLGTARTGAYFSLAPFVGAALAVAVLGEPPSARLLLAAGLMALGLWLHLAERHEHEHAHEPEEHEHRHAHDEHHRHAHVPASRWRSRTPTGTATSPSCTGTRTTPTCTTATSIERLPKRKHRLPWRRSTRPGHPWRASPRR
jgi:hypothetical protein